MAFTRIGTDLSKRYEAEIDDETRAEYAALMKQRANKGKLVPDIEEEVVEHPKGFTDINAQALEPTETREDLGGVEPRSRNKGETGEQYSDFLIKDLLEQSPTEDLGVGPVEPVVSTIPNIDAAGNLVAEDAVGGSRFAQDPDSPERNALEMSRVPDSVEAREDYVSGIPNTDVGKKRNIMREATTVQDLQKHAGNVKTEFDTVMQEWGYLGQIQDPTVRSKINSFLKSSKNNNPENMQEFVYGDLAGAARAHNANSPIEASLVMTMGALYDLANRERTASRDLLDLDEYPKSEEEWKKLTHAQRRGIRAVERNAWHDQYDAEGSSMGATIARGLGMATDGNSNAMLGAMAEAIVPSALGTSKDIDGDAIFTTKRVFQQDETFKDVLSLTRAGMDLVDKNMNLFNHMLKIPDKLPKVGDAGLKTTMPKSLDIRLKGKIDGNHFTDINAEKKFIKALFLMDNTAFRMQETQVDALSLMMGADYSTGANTANAVSDLFDSRSYKKIDKGGVLGKREKSYTVVNEDGSKEELANHSDEWKDTIALRNILFAKQTIGQDIRFDHFTGSNWRTYLDSKLLNYQAEHLVRANIGFAKAIPFKLNNKKHMLLLKAGIMKKTGMGPAGLEIKYEGMRPEAGQEAFDNIIKEWQAKWGALVGEFEMFNISGKMGEAETQLEIKQSFANPEHPTAIAARELVEYAADYEGYYTINSIIEAIKLKNALDNKTSNHYATNFQFEVDGIANGLAINALFSAMGAVAKQTGITKDLIKGYLDDRNLLTDMDVYQFHAAQVHRLLTDNSGSGGASTAELAKLLAEVGILGRKGSKKPIMISSYSAGIELIKDKVNEALLDAKASNPEFVARLKKIGWDIDSTTKVLGDTYWDGIVSTLGEIRHYGQYVGEFMSEILKQRAENPDLPAPSLILPEGAILHFGLMVPTIEGPIIEFMGRDLRRTTMRLVPEAQEVSKRTGEFVGYAKAQVSINPVTTHAMDSFVNINSTVRFGEESPAKKYDVNGNIMGQVFDGFFTSPMFMEEMNTVLNEEFMLLGDRKSNLESLIDTAKAAGYDVNKGYMNILTPKMMAMASNAKKKMKLYRNVNQYPATGGVETHTVQTGTDFDDYKRVFTHTSLAEGVLLEDERFLGKDDEVKYGNYEFSDSVVPESTQVATPDDKLHVNGPQGVFKGDPEQARLANEQVATAKLELKPDMATLAVNNTPRSAQAGQIKGQMNDFSVGERVYLKEHGLEGVVDKIDSRYGTYFVKVIDENGAPILIAAKADGLVAN